MAVSQQQKQQKRAHKGGMPAGHKTQKTIEKEAARAILRQMVLEKLQPLVDAQIDNAVGLKYLVARNAKTGKFERVTAEMLEAEGTDHERIEVFEKDPSVQAFADLMDRAIDKPKSTTDLNVNVNEKQLEERLKGARKRTGG